jgi:subtilisin family serine protease
MMRALLIAMLLISSAAAQILPGPGRSLVPGGLPALGLPSPQQSLPLLARPLRAPLRRLEEARQRRIQRLLHRYPQAIEADPNGDPIVRAEVLAVAPSDAALAQAQAAGFSVVRERALTGLGIRLILLRAPGGTSTARALAQLRRLDPAGTYDFDPIYLDSGEGAASAAGAAAPRGRAPVAAVDAARAQTSAVVGLIDGGVDATQPLFQGAWIHQHGCAGIAVPSAHGTAVASLMIAKSAQFAGAVPGALLYADDVFCGKPTGGAADAIAAAFAWMVRKGVPVINVSLVGPPNALLQQVIARVLAQGSLVVAAVGNDGPAAPPLYPAAYPGVIGVTAVDAKERVLFEAERGPQVMFAAPGADIEAARLPRGLAAVRGTSFAAPLVSGLLARQLHRPDPQAARMAVEHLIGRAIHLGGADRNPIYGYGLVGAHLPGGSWQASAAFN